MVLFSLNTVHRPDAATLRAGRSHTLRRPRRGWAQVRRSEYTVVPVGNLPLEEVSVPKSQTRKQLLSFGGLLCSSQLGQVACPPLRETPQGTTLGFRLAHNFPVHLPQGPAGRKDKGVRLLQDPRPPSTQKQVNLYTLRHKQCEIMKYGTKHNLVG